MKLLAAIVIELLAGTVPVSAQTGNSPVYNDVSIAVPGTGAITSQSVGQELANILPVTRYGAKCNGSDSDADAFQAALDDRAKLPTNYRAAIFIPGDRTCVIDKPLKVQVGRDSTFTMFSDGLHGARLVIPAYFQETVLDITMTGQAPIGDTSGGFAVSLSGLTFMRSGTDTGGTAVSVTTSGGGAALPALDISKLTFTSSTGGSFARGLVLQADNVTTLSDIYCTVGFNGICVSYDTPGQISVEHHIKDLYINGTSGGVGLQIGHQGLTGALQGFSIRGLSCTGSDYCIKAVSAGGGPIDEITVEGSQIAANIDGIYDSGANTLIVTGNYFLGGSRAIDAENMDRLVVTGNTFYLGPDSTNTQNNALGTNHNISVYTKSLGGDPATGGVVSGNVFTNLYGVPIYLDTGTNYVSISGNTCLGNICVNDRSGNSQNGIGPNLDNGKWSFATAATFNAGLSTAGLLSANKGAAITGPVVFGSPTGGINWTFKSDGVGNATFLSSLTSGAGTLELGPNLKLDGQVQMGNAQISGGSGTFDSAKATTLVFDPTGSAPASSTSGCTPGQTAWSTGFIYLCVAANRWQRAALSSY